MIGHLTKLFNNRLFLLLLSLQFIIAIAVAAHHSYSRTGNECLNCHSDAARMKSLGYPFFHVTQERIEKESGHKGVKCRECHGGNSRAKNPETAHKGIFRAYYLNTSATPVIRSKPAAQALTPTGNYPLVSMVPGGGFMGVILHDRNMNTLGYDPDLGKAACGSSNCHPEQVSQFSHTVMGANKRQRHATSWLQPYGPHNCGPSFADSAEGDTASGDKFSFDNQRVIANEVSVAFKPEQAMLAQRLCNQCHVGCLDCHYSPLKNGGAHSFAKKPPSENCMGGGRGAVSCHAATLGGRRGDEYLGGGFSYLPPGSIEPDVHVKQKIECVDCHQTGIKGMGDIQRNAACGDCHVDIEEAIASSEHKAVSCAACHVSVAGGYQLTHWGPGVFDGKDMPFYKYGYDGTYRPPIIMKDQGGRWIPVKAWPDSVANFKNTVPPGDGVMFRWPNGETHDSYILLGTFDGLPDGNKHLAWIEIEQVSHPYGKPRECISCHSGVQTAESRWKYEGLEAEHFSGSYKVTADASGIRIHDMVSGPVTPKSGRIKTSFFAPWLYLGDIWKGKGDFSIPGKGYDDAARRYDEAVKKLELLKPGIPEKRYKKLRAILLHNPEANPP